MLNFLNIRGTGGLIFKKKIFSKIEPLLPGGGGVKFTEQINIFIYVFLNTENPLTIIKINQIEHQLNKFQIFTNYI